MFILLTPTLGVWTIKQGLNIPKCKTSLLCLQNKIQLLPLFSSLRCSGIRCPLLLCPGVHCWYVQVPNVDMSRCPMLLDNVDTPLLNVTPMSWQPPVSSDQGNQGPVWVATMTTEHPHLNNWGSATQYMSAMLLIIILLLEADYCPVNLRWGDVSSWCLCCDPVTDSHHDTGLVTMVNIIMTTVTMETFAPVECGPTVPAPVHQWWPGTR